MEINANYVRHAFRDPDANLLEVFADIKYSRSAESQRPVVEA